MNIMVTTTLLALAIVPVSLVFAPSAFADTTTICYPVTQSRVVQDAADHPNAYADGYREGTQSARQGEPYKVRTVGGEFARGFDDGYYGRSFSGQSVAVPNQVEYYTTQRCNTYTTHQHNPFHQRVFQPNPFGQHHPHNPVRPNHHRGLLR